MNVQTSIPCGVIRKEDQSKSLFPPTRLSVHTVTELKYGTILFFKSDLANFSKIYWALEKNVLISIEALTCGYFVPKKLRARPPNKASTPI